METAAATPTPTTTTSVVSSIALLQLARSQHLTSLLLLLLLLLLILYFSLTGPVYGVTSVWPGFPETESLMTSTCVLSNSGLSNATSKRPKLAFFCGKICPPQSQNCQNQILHISKINFYFGFRWYSRYSQCRLVLNLFEFLWRYVEKYGKRNWKTGKNRNSHTSKIVCILLVCLINNRHLANHISEPYAKLTGKW